MELKQSDGMAKIRLELAEGSLTYTKTEFDTIKRTWDLKTITGLFRDDQRCYIVAGTEVQSFLHQPGDAAYESYVGELVRRLTLNQ